MQKPVLVLALTLSLFAAGCLSSGAPSSEQPLAPASDTVPEVPDLLHGLRFEGCVEQAGVFPVPASHLASQIPEGWNLATFDPAGTLGIVFTTVFTCQSSELDALGEPRGEPEEVTEILGLIAVQPPEGYELEGAAFHGYAFAMGTTSARNAATYAAWSPGITFAEAPRLETLVHEDQLTIMETGSTAPFGEYRGITQGPAGASEPGAARLFLPGADGEVAGIADGIWTGGSFRGDGEIVLTWGLGSVPPGHPGIALHWWGDDYRIDFLHQPFEAESAEPAPASAAPLGGPLAPALTALRARLN